MKSDPMNLLEAWLREDDSGAAYYRAIQPDIPVSLVSASNYVRILEVASRVPGVCALDGFYFEFVLGEAAARADISFLAAPTHGCPGTLATWQPDGPWPQGDPWFTLQRLAAQWNLPGEPLHEKVAVIWLEFDAHGTQPYSPSLFFTPAFPPDPRDLHMQGCRSLLSCLARELSETISPASLPVALTCLEQLPEKGWLAQVGCMLSRRPATLRLCLGLPGEAILEYLKRLKAPADLPRVAEILDLFSAYDDEFFLHLDLLEDLQPKVGLDLMVSPDKQFHDPPELKVLDELCHLKLCTRTKKEALQNIIGYTAMGANLIDWPPALRRRFLDSNLADISYLVRGLSHFKVVIDPGQDLCAKAYVRISPCWNR